MAARPLGTWILLALLPAWLIGSAALLKAQWKGAGLVMSLISEPGMKEAATLKPVDRLALSADGLVPTGSKVFFFNPYPSDSPTGGFYAGRLRYQLYGRSLVVLDPGQEFDFMSLGRGDFLMFITPAGQPGGLEGELKAFMGLDELYSARDGRGGSVALYRVARGG